MMRGIIYYLIRHLLFFLGFFLFFRILFVLYFFQRFSEIGIDSVLKAISFYNFRLDVSVFAYLMTLPYLVFAAGTFFSGSWVRIFHQSWIAVFMFIMSVIGLGNMIIYNEWGTLINARAISYASSPKDVIASASNLVLTAGVTGWFLLAFVFYYLYSKFVFKKNGIIIKNTAVKILSPLIIFPLLFAAARGGTQLIPVNESAAYFSNVPIVNHLSTNCYWYLGHNLIQSRFLESELYHFMPEDEAKNRVNKLLHGRPDSAVSVLKLNNPHPNIVMIILESWSADLIEKAGGEKNVTPGFNRLSREGIVFSNVYSSGFRTDQGIISILSGFPAQPNVSIIRHPDKTLKLPSLSAELKKNGYHNSFYYGGEIGFANLKSYLLNAGFDRIIDKSDFPDSTFSNKWGAHDEFVFEKHSLELTGLAQPFFSMLLTLSSHEPFDIPEKTPFDSSQTEPDRFRAAAFYTDKYLERYFEKIRSLPFFDNTFFILLGDHGHRLPKERQYDDPLARRMTLMFYGPMIREEFRNTINASLSRLCDLPATILQQLDFNDAPFRWSNNIYNLNRNQFAYLSLDYAFTWMVPGEYAIIPFREGSVYFSNQGKFLHQEDILDAKSFLQILYSEYLEY